MRERGNEGIISDGLGSQLPQWAGRASRMATQCSQWNHPGTAAIDRGSSWTALKAPSRTSPNFSIRSGKAFVFAKGNTEDDVGRDLFLRDLPRAGHVFLLTEAVRRWRRASKNVVQPLADALLGGVVAIRCFLRQLLRLAVEPGESLLGIVLRGLGDKRSQDQLYYHRNHLRYNSRDSSSAKQMYLEPCARPGRNQ